MILVISAVIFSMVLGIYIGAKHERDAIRFAHKMTSAIKNHFDDIESEESPITQENTND